MSCITSFITGYKMRCYRTICTLIVEKVKGEQIGVTRDYPITVTSI